MKIVLKNYSPGLHIKKELKKLYTEAFPSDERAPFFVMMSKVRKKKADWLIAYDGEKFVGFAYMVCKDDLVYLFYLAVCANIRGNGIGGAILDEVKKLYSGKLVFLAREQLDENADNYKQRLSRHRFYLRCGFADTPYCIKEASVTYDVMSTGGAISPQEYADLMTAWGGKLLTRIVDMKLFIRE